MSEGKYIVAPERKASVYTCRVSVGKSPGELRIYCDGERIWRILDNGPSREVRTYTLAKLLEAREQIDKTLLGPELTAQLIRDDDAEHGFLGPRGVLLEMKEKLVWSGVKHGQLPGGRSVFILEGEWTKAFVDKLAPARKEGGSGPDLREMWTKRTGFIRIPRRCLLYLDKETLWPYRVEWQGPTVPEGKDEALVILEFQTPSLSAPASPEAFAKIFQPSDSEKEAAQEMDPALILQTRERNLLRQTRQEAESSRDQPLLDPTAPHKRP
ncbi:MAG: hypothetical protein NZM31_00780 [Gemmatales bacterium]|nr:hypothetical protein [Gemmatales bacterium]MDW8385528.1 hypothetical protein [Gemmatales bacterium]